jgi:hypothetical protein
MAGLREATMPPTLLLLPELEEVEVVVVTAEARGRETEVEEENWKVDLPNLSTMQRAIQL